MAARFTWPRRSILPLVSSSCDSQASTVASGRELREQRGELEIRRGQLLGDAFAAHAHLLRGQPRVIQADARGLQPLLDRGARRIALAQQRVQLIAGNLAPPAVRLDLRATPQCPLELRLRAGERRLAVRELRRQFVAPRVQILELLLEARQRRRQATACEERRDSTCTANSRACCCAAWRRGARRASSARMRSRSCSSSMRCGSSAASASMAVSMRPRAARSSVSLRSSSARTSASSVSSCAQAPRRIRRCAPGRNRARRADRHVRDAAD